MTSNDRLAPLLLNNLKAQSVADRTFISGIFKLSYKNLFLEICRAQDLFVSSSLKPGDRIVIASSYAPAVATIYLAGLCFGLVLVVLDAESSGSEANVLINAARPKAVFGSAEFINKASRLSNNYDVKVVEVDGQDKRNRPLRGWFSKGEANKSQFLFLEAFTEPVMQEPLMCDLDEDAPALILFTSGTTSQPKGVVLSRKALVAQMTTLRSRFRLGAENRVLNHLPLHHSDGLNQGALLCAITGSQWIIPPAVNMATAGDLLDLCYRTKVTHLITVPAVLAMLERLPSEYNSALDFPEFQILESTAGFLDANLWRRFESRFGVRITNCYGLTETVCEALFAGPDDKSHVIGTIGKPEGFEMRLIDDHGVDVDINSVGELLLRGDSLFDGYFENPSATDEAFIDGWFRSGDLCEVNEEGITRIVGRKKNVIQRASINVYPEDVNHYALACEFVLEAETIGLPDEALGERVVLAVVTEGQGDDWQRNYIYEHFRRTASRERWPDEIFITTEFPRGPSGKVELSRLASLVKTASGWSHQNTIRDGVLSVAAKAFGTEVSLLREDHTQYDIDGWDSLRFLTFIVMLEQSYNVEFETRMVMGIESLRDAIVMVGDHPDVRKK